MAAAFEEMDPPIMETRLRHETDDELPESPSFSSSGASIASWNSLPVPREEFLNPELKVRVSVSMDHSEVMGTNNGHISPPNMPSSGIGSSGIERSQKLQGNFDHLDVPQMQMTPLSLSDRDSPTSGERSIHMIGLFACL